MRLLFFWLSWLGVALGAADYSARLKALGYRPSEISEMKPSVARVVARRGLPRPQSGMPESWRVTPSPTKKKQSLISRITKVAKATAKVVSMVAYRVVLPAGLLVAFRGNVWPTIALIASQLNSASNYIQQSFQNSFEQRRANQKESRKEKRPTGTSIRLPPTDQHDQLEQELVRRRQPDPIFDEVLLDGPDDRSLR